MSTSAAPIQPTVTPEARFGAVMPNATQLQKIGDLRAGFADLCAIVEAHTPPGRERALAVTALEESCMWAVKAVTRGP